MVSDPKEWETCSERARQINQQIKDLQLECIRHGLVLTAIHFDNNLWLHVYGKGLMEHFDDHRVEVWQGSAGCSDQGSTYFPAPDDIILTPIPGEDDYWQASGLGC